MPQLKPSLVHAAVAPSNGEERRVVCRFPSGRVHVHVIGLDALRAAGLQAIFEKNPAIEIVVEDASCLPNSSWEMDHPAGAVVVVSAQADADMLRLIGSIRSAHPNLPILAMSHASGREAIARVLMLGAKGFLHDSCTSSQFEKAVQMAASGSIWAPRRVLSELIDRLLASRDTQSPNSGVMFTGREQQVLDLLLDGRSNREIAVSLNIEERTVKSYVTKLMRKMGVTNRIALSMRAQKR